MMNNAVITKKLFAAVGLTAVLALSGCLKKESAVDPAPSNPVIESLAVSTSSSSESSSSSLESTPVSIEKPKIGDLMGPEDLPSRGKAFCICTETDYGADSSVNVTSYLAYDEHDNLIAIVGEKSYYYAYEYDKDGNITKEYDNGAEVYTEYEYKDGNVVKMRYHGRDGASFDEEYEYDEHGTVIKTTKYVVLLDDTSVSEIKPEYDVQGRLVRKTDYSSDGSVYCIDEYEYSDKGEIVKETCSLGGAKTVREYSLDERGNRLSGHIKRVNDDGTVISEYRTEYEYNSDNKLTSEKQFIIKNGMETLRRASDYAYEY